MEFLGRYGPLRRWVSEAIYTGSPARKLNGLPKARGAVRQMQHPTHKNAQPLAKAFVCATLGLASAGSRFVKLGRWMAMMTGGSVVAFALAFTPALSAPGDTRVLKPRPVLVPRADLGVFTPANGDPRLAAVLARSGLGASGFRFTPATTSVRLGRSVTVAVRARNGAAPVLSERAALVNPSQATGLSALTPIAYSLGVAVGWRRFAVSSEVAKVDLGALGGREVVDVGVSYTARKFSTRVAVGADQATPGTPRALALGNNGYTVDLGGSYRLSRNLDLTAGVRYRTSERDRLAPLADNRRDSQAVYVGTAFKF
jgi:hypothetical protein